jgi:trk system potassium uptake protein TrkH
LNHRFDLYLLGWLLLMASAFLALPLVAAFIFGEPVLPFVGSMLLAAAAGAGLVYPNRHAKRLIRPRDGFLVVAGSWLLVSLLGAFPYLLSGTLPLADAFFESVSGFTTTGSTVVTDTAAVARSLLLWRAMTQWLGGMGIILFTIAILPLLGIGGMQLFRAEVPGPVADKVQPRLASTARSLWGIYVGFTAAEWLALKLAGVNGFEALCHSFTTLATGGFSTRNGSIGELGSATVEWIIIFFMLVAGINFVLHFKLLTGRGREILRDIELRYFLLVVVVAVTALVIVLHSSQARLVDTVRTAAFQAISILTTTGYVTTDFELWPQMPQLLLLVLMVLGGMSGSTGGGIKSLRALLALSSLRATIDRLIHPHAVRPVKYAGTVVSESVLSGVWAFLTAYLVISIFGASVVASYGYDLVTSFSASLTAISNVGPGLGGVGAYDNFAHFPALVKVVLAGCMLFGRLEIFTLLVIISRSFWRR